MLKSIYYLINLVLVIFLNGCNYKTPEIHYLPNGFTGKVEISYNIKGGQNNKEGYYRVYYIPKDGKVNSASYIYPNMDLDKISFYMHDINGDTTKLRMFFYELIETYEQIDSNEICIHDYNAYYSNYIDSNFWTIIYNVDTFKTIMRNRGKGLKYHEE